MSRLVCAVLDNHGIEPGEVTIQTFDEGQIKLKNPISPEVKKEIIAVCEEWARIGIHWKFMETHYNPCQQMQFRADQQFYPSQKQEFHLTSVPPKESLEFMSQTLQEQS